MLGGPASGSLRRWQPKCNLELQFLEGARGPTSKLTQVAFGRRLQFLATGSLDRATHKTGQLTSSEESDERKRERERRQGQEERDKKGEIEGKEKRGGGGKGGRKGEREGETKRRGGGP